MRNRFLSDWRRYVIFAVVVSFALLCSLIVALTLIPAAAARWLPDIQKQRSEATGAAKLVIEGTGSGLRWLERTYGRLLESVILHPFRIIGVAVLLFVACFFLMPMVGFELMPESDEGRLNLSAELEIGTPVETTMVTMQELELKVRGALREGELDHIVTTAGPDGWWRAAAGISSARAAAADTGSAQLTAREILDRGAAKIRTELAEQPIELLARVAFERIHGRV